MAQLIVRNIEEGVKRKLQRRAKRHRHSMEEEIRDILRNAVKEEDTRPGGLGTRISSIFAKTGIDFDIPELRGYEIKPPSFEE